MLGFHLDVLQVHFLELVQHVVWVSRIPCRHLQEQYLFIVVIRCYRNLD